MQKDRLAGVVAFTIAVTASDVAIAVPLYALGSLLGHPPARFIAVVALTSALVHFGVLRLPQSGWQVPKGWAGLGHTSFAAVFGGILGLGVLTAMPSAGYCVLLVWALTVAHWAHIWPAFAAFGLGRASPLLVLVAVSRDRRDYAGRIVRWSSAMARLAGRGELALLAATFTAFILTPRM